MGGNRARKFALLVPALAAGVIAVFLQAPPPGHAREIDGVVEPGEYSGRFDGGERFTLYWETAGDLVHLALEGRTGGWVAVGLDPVRAMDRADMLLGMVREDGSVTVVDSFSAGPYGPHPADTELGGTADVLEYAGIERGGATVIELSRRIETGDEFDRPFTGAGQRIIWALGAEDDFSSPHRERGSGVLASGAPDAEPAEGGPRPASKDAAAARAGPPVPYRAALLVHAWLMTAAALAMGLGMLIPRYLKQHRWWMRAHRSLGVAGPCLGGLGIGAAVYLVGVSTGIHLRVVHAWAGAAAAAGFVATPLLCRYLFAAPKEKKKPLRASHRWAGRAALLLMLGALVLGLFQAGFL
ncbi:MAG: DOMON domain-containing protein [Spirochaetota bacterium]